MAVSNLNHVGVWHVRGPRYDVCLILLGDEKRGFVQAYTVVYPERKDTRIIRLPDAATAQQAVTTTDEMFAQLESGKTPLRGPWGKTTKLIVNGTREQLLAAVRIKGIDIGTILN
jgi:hypothetical protein